MSDKAPELSELATVRLIHGSQVAIESFLSSLPSTRFYHKTITP